MAIIKVISTQNIANLNGYILDGKPHSNKITSQRCLAFAVSKNLTPSFSKGGVSSRWISSQEKATRIRVGKDKKKTQGYHAIISFSENDFPLPKNSKDLQRQAMQAGKLGVKFLSQELPPEAQYLIGVQRDGEGHMLHLHCAISSVRTDGKVLDTNLLRVKDKKGDDGLYERMQSFLEDNFDKVTHRRYHPVRGKITPSKSQEKMARNHGQYLWKDDLTKRIVLAQARAKSLAEFEQLLDEDGVKIKKRRAGIGKDDTGRKKYRDAYTYSFTDAEGKSRKCRDFAYSKTGSVKGLGHSFTPDGIKRALQKENLVKVKEVEVTSVTKDSEFEFSL